jgi:hypothetical protein
MNNYSNDSWLFIFYIYYCIQKVFFFLVNQKKKKKLVSFGCLFFSLDVRFDEHLILLHLMKFVGRIFTMIKQQFKLYYLDLEGCFWVSVKEDNDFSQPTGLNTSGRLLWRPH